jgi:hypothetical protein
MEKYKKYKEAFPNKTDAQCIESLCWEVSDKVETIHKLLEDMADKKYTKEDIEKAIQIGIEYGHQKGYEAYYYIDEIINSLNKQD